jgi:periplasmic iron binding protein
MMNRSFQFAAALSLLFACGAEAREYYVGGPVHQHDMEIVANYLVGIEMAPMTANMVHGPDVIHLEADVHATADNVYGFPDGAWMAYLTIHYKLEKTGSSWTSEGVLLPMTAKDGPHYANNVKMDGPGEYKLTYRFEPPESNGFLHHTDEETGVPDWWKPFTQEFTFKYPQK